MAITDGERWSHEDWTDYGDAESVPFGPKLSSYLLHHEEGRQAFLERLLEVGDNGLWEATDRVYELLSEPRECQAAIIGQAAGVSGLGESAIYQTLQTFLYEWQATPSLPSIEDCGGNKRWGTRLVAIYAEERSREQWVIRKFAAALDGRTLGPEPNALDPYE